MKSKRKYKIVQADAFEWLKSRRASSVHAIVTDPPYGVVEYSPSELRKRARGKGIWRLPHAFDGWERNPMPRFTVLTTGDHEKISKFHSDLSSVFFKVLVPGGHVIIASQTLFMHLVLPPYLQAGFELRGQVARTVYTLRGGDRPKGAHDEFKNVSVIPRSRWEPWIILRKPFHGTVRENLRKWKTGALRRPSEHRPFEDLIETGTTPIAERKIASHPSLKPQTLMRQLVRASLPLGKGIILDPFMGSGSTIAAATALGIKSIGVEINASFFKQAKEAIPKLASLADRAAEPSKVRKKANGFDGLNGHDHARSARARIRVRDRGRAHSGDRPSAR